MDLNELIKIYVGKSTLSDPAQASITLKAVIVFFGINAIISIGSIVTQFALKNKDFKIDSNNLKRKDKIEVYKKLFSEINMIKKTLPGDCSNTELYKMIQDARYYADTNSLIIDNKVIEIINDALDQLITRRAFPENWDEKVFAKTMINFKTQYNKI